MKWERNSEETKLRVAWSKSCRPFSDVAKVKTLELPECDRKIWVFTPI